jgi:hypothetical protein
MQSVQSIEAMDDYGSWYWFLFITIVFILLYYAALSYVDIVEISKNWSKYRCSPAIMPFASAYGYNTSENFNYCIQNIFKTQMGQATGPFGTILSSIMISMVQFIKNLNSVRIMMATLLGGITKVFQEFTDRFKLFMGQTQITALRIQMLMKRVFGILFSIIYMGLSAITAGNNFLQTFIFKFLDTFCFAPETYIRIKGRGQIQIQYVQIGDILEDSNDIVTSTYRFMADGQPMVRLGPVQVSTNHFVMYKGAWIQAKDHPDAIQVADWSGGQLRPLICLDTLTHKIPINNYVFSDWDETASSDTKVMELAEQILNGTLPTKRLRNWPLQPALDGNMAIRMASGGTKRVKHIRIGDFTSTGRVVGKGVRSVSMVCILPSGLHVTPSQLLWCKTRWVRAGHLYPVHYMSELLYTFVIMNSAIIETDTGRIFRDMLEVHSPAMEEPTEAALKNQSNPTSQERKCSNVLKHPIDTQQDGIGR